MDWSIHNSLFRHYPDTLVATITQWWPPLNAYRRYVRVVVSMEVVPKRHTRTECNASGFLRLCGQAELIDFVGVKLSSIKITNFGVCLCVTVFFFSSLFRTNLIEYRQSRHLWSCIPYVNYKVLTTVIGVWWSLIRCRSINFPFVIAIVNDSI